MPVPDFQSLMLPALNALADGADTPLATVRQRVADSEGLTPEDLLEPLPSGRQTKFVNRISWAVIYMSRAGLVERVGRGIYRLTAVGRELLVNAPQRIDIAFLQQYPAYTGWESTNRSTATPADQPPQDFASTETPIEALDSVVGELRTVLQAEVLDHVRNAEPDFLERLIVDLLIAMGYGGGDDARGAVTGRSGDGGIDGTIKEDALGLDEVYIQAKKYADGNTVGEPDLRNFVGAIDAAGTTKGVFVTTSTFTRAAKDYLARSPKRIVLIDGMELARLMVQYNIGVRVQTTLEIKSLDEDYFEQDGI